MLDGFMKDGKVESLAKDLGCTVEDLLRWGLKAQLVLFIQKLNLGKTYRQDKIKFGTWK